ncbi:MAG: hypothetical protein OQK50_03430 [Deltaproteobacteria bacterium]|jgi:cytochrome c5|nr:hypothetical protein [Deltaproteobacteria bacterium]MCW8893392.1 hypothetical protein [Deltaproteobacteria bacterium]MCW9049366.1 hypothetical protein [Deltaproteobacteria bacterium]
MKILFITLTVLYCSRSFPVNISAGERYQGAGIYADFCAQCHDSGMAGAPDVGDKEAWNLRI